MPADDNDIIQRVLAGERQAFGVLIDRHRQKAMTLALRMLKNPQDAEEALMDAFVRAHNALDRFERKSSFSTWFYRILFNVCYSHLRRARPEELHLDIEVPDTRSRDHDRPDNVYAAGELERIVAEEIGAMPAVYGGVFTLFLVQEMSYEEIAEVTGLPLNTVKTRLFRARTMLRERVAARLQDGASYISGRTPDRAAKERS
jgi:RNA polymerase sigma-70 factor (ECF subfamily)